MLFPFYYIISLRIPKFPQVSNINQAELLIILYRRVILICLFDLHDPSDTADHHSSFTQISVKTNSNAQWIEYHMWFKMRLFTLLMSLICWSRRKRRWFLGALGANGLRLSIISIVSRFGPHIYREGNQVADKLRILWKSSRFFLVVEFTVLDFCTHLASYRNGWPFFPSGSQFFWQICTLFRLQGVSHGSTLSTGITTDNCQVLFYFYFF